MSRRPTSALIVPAVWALVGVVGLTAILSSAGPVPTTGDDAATEGAVASAEPDPVPEPPTITSTPAAEPTAAPGGSETAAAGETAEPGSLRLRERDPDAPRGPQPIPAADVVPVRVEIPAIGVDSALEDLDRNGEGVLQPPVIPEQAGWFIGGTVPGDRGPAVIAGHVDSGVAGAVFRDLDELRPGAEILVHMSDGAVVTFVMDRSDVVRQAQFPSLEVYGPVPDRQLRLITCHTFDPDEGRYVDNLVVFATAR